MLLRTRWARSTGTGSAGKAARQMRPPRLTILAASLSAFGAPEHSSTYWTPLPRVIRWTASTGSSSLTLTTVSAPSRLPIASLRSRVPVRITGCAPSALATPTPIRPIGPGPITTTASPAIMPPITSRPYMAVPEATLIVTSGTAMYGLDVMGGIIAYRVRNADHRVDIVDSVFGEAAVGAEAVGAVTFVAEAVIEARGVHAFATALAAPASGMDLDGDAVADLEFVDGGAEPDDRAHVFMARCEAPIERELTVHHRGQPVLEYFNVGGADRNRVDTDQHLCRARLRHRLLAQHQLFRAPEHPGLHGLGDGVFIGAVLRHTEAPIRCYFWASADCGALSQTSVRS